MQKINANISININIYGVYFFQVSIIHGFGQSSLSFTMIPESGFLHEADRKHRTADI